MKNSFLLILLLFLSGCAAGPDAVTPAASSTLQPVVASPSSSAPVADVTVNREQFGQVIELRVGQVVRLVPPAANESWQVDFDPALFQPLTPQEQLRTPDESGWLFKVAAAGDGQIVLTSIVSCPKPPCPLMPMRFQINFHVQ